MYEAGCGEPDADECGDELAEADAVTRLQHIEVLQDIWDCHQAQHAREPEACNMAAGIVTRGEERN